MYVSRSRLVQMPIKGDVRATARVDVTSRSMTTCVKSTSLTTLTDPTVSTRCAVRHEFEVSTPLTPSPSHLSGFDLGGCAEEVSQLLNHLWLHTRVFRRHSITLALPNRNTCVDTSWCNVYSHIVYVIVCPSR
jgi:hypothetical protein